MEERPLKKSRPAFPRASPEITAGTRRAAPAAGEIRAGTGAGVGGAARGREGTRGDTRGDTRDGDAGADGAALHAVLPRDSIRSSTRWEHRGFGSAAAVAMGKPRHGRAYRHGHGWQGAEEGDRRERSPTRRFSGPTKRFDVSYEPKTRRAAELLAPTAAPGNANPGLRTAQPRTAPHGSAAALPAQRSTIFGTAALSKIGRAHV